MESLKAWLISGDPVIRRMYDVHLEEKDAPYVHDGLIKAYMDRYDHQKKRFGGGIYSPKWISTHYTLLDLMHLDIDPKHPIYLEGIKTLLDHLWQKDGYVNTYRHQDLCIVGMLVSMSCYASLDDPRIHEMMDYLLAHTMPDGGFNCAYETHPTKISSVHTTLSVLEGLQTYLDHGYRYRMHDVIRQKVLAEELLLKRHLYKSFKDGRPMHDQMTKVHLQPRWKYDILRALTYFVRSEHPYDERMADAIGLLIKQMKDGKVRKGSSYAGLIHFPLEEGPFSRINTIKVLDILKHYQPNSYQRLMT